MICKENKKKADEILGTLREAFQFDSSRRAGIHVSDLVYCLRKAYFRNTGHPEDNSESVLYFVRGRSLHDLLEKVYKRREVTIEYGGVTGTIDAVTPEGVIVEIKTMKSVYNNKPSDTHLDQIATYMAMTNSHRGIILVYDMTANKLRYFEVEMDDDQIAAKLAALKYRRETIEDMLSLKDPLLVTRPDNNWECDHCSYNPLCEKLEEAGKDTTK